jgi:hypothetical protein
MSPLPATHSIDLAAISFRRSSGSPIARSEERLEDVVPFRRRRAVIVEALGGVSGIDALCDELGDVDDSLALIDSRLDVVTDLHQRGWFRRRTVDADVAAATGHSCGSARLGDPHGRQPQVDAH